jgi:sporulation protein YtfJ
MMQHPIEGLMKVAMENIREMVDVNTIVGDPVETSDGTVVMPISKVGFGFMAGGSEFAAHLEANSESSASQGSLPFGGGTGGGVSITPIAFLVVGPFGVKVVPLDNQTHVLERIIESAPMVVDKIQQFIGSMVNTTIDSDAGLNPSFPANNADLNKSSPNPKFII